MKHELQLEPDLSLPQATLVARMSRDRLMRVIASGAVTARLAPDRRWRVDAESLQQFVERQRAEQFNPSNLVS